MYSALNSPKDWIPRYMRRYRYVECRPVNGQAYDLNAY